MRAAWLLAMSGIGGALGSARADAPPKPTLLHPVAMAGPYKTAVQACHGAPPCGDTAFAPDGIHEIHPATTTSCPAIEGGDDSSDPNASSPFAANAPEPSRTSLTHAAKGMTVRIGSQRCAQPEGLREERDIYFVLVKRADGWWRSAPLWFWDYNDKYEGGTTLVHWNDQPYATFVGVAAGYTDAIECERQGSLEATSELLIRIEPGTTRPLVWAPLVVGRRYDREPLDPSDPSDVAACPAIKNAQELTETWSSHDDLQLSGAAKWPTLHREGTALYIGPPDTKSNEPSSAGSYRFVRDAPN